MICKLQTLDEFGIAYDLMYCSQIKYPDGIMYRFTWRPWNDGDCCKLPKLFDDKENDDSIRLILADSVG